MKVPPLTIVPKKSTSLALFLAKKIPGADAALAAQPWFHRLAKIVGWGEDGKQPVS
jgi:hypothetical protein